MMSVQENGMVKYVVPPVAAPAGVEDTQAVFGVENVSFGYDHS